MPIRTEQEKWQVINNTYAQTIELLKNARQAKGWSRYWLARQTNLTPSTITRFENNETRVSFETIIMIAQVLDVNIITITNARTENKSILETY